jgi:uroporphyrinogen decarboxylase
LEDVVDLQSVAPRYIGPPLPAGTDIWGVYRSAISYGDGEYDEIAHYPLGSAKTVGDIHRHVWPSADWFDYESMRPRIDSLKDRRYAIWAYGWGNIFESAWYMRGFERMLMDIATEPELAQAILTHVTDFFVEFYHRLLAAGRGDIDIAFTADDLGSQTGLLMSVPMWAEHVKPHHTRLNQALHERGVKIAYHSDGAIMPVVADLRDMGIDILEALQFDAARMDPLELKNRHGRSLCFAGGVSVQHTLPFGSVDDVRRETRMLIDVLGRDGGYLCGPSHAIQAGTPPENIVAMFDEAASIY